MLETLRARRSDSERRGRGEVNAASGARKEVELAEVRQLSTNVLIDRPNLNVTSRPARDTSH